jgi:hypothetical protein
MLHKISGSDESNYIDNESHLGYNIDENNENEMEYFENIWTR